MAATHFSGPVVSTNGFTGALTGAVTATTVTASTSLAVGSGGATIKAIKSGTVSVTVAALNDGAEADVDVTITGLAAGDAVLIFPTDAAAETGLYYNCWVGGADTATIRMGNVKGSALTGSTANWTYLWFDLT